MDPRHAIETLVYKSCMLLDSYDFASFLELCDNSFRYQITTFSPEIRKEMIWLEHDKEGMRLLFNNLPRHNSDHSLLSRHATVYTVDYDPAKSEAKVVTALQVFRTTLDGGATELFAVGKLFDWVKVSGDSARLLSRNVKLETRMFGIGNHIPF